MQSYIFLGGGVIKNEIFFEIKLKKHVFHTKPDVSVTFRASRIAENPPQKTYMVYRKNNV